MCITHQLVLRPQNVIQLLLAYDKFSCDNDCHLLYSVMATETLRKTKRIWSRGSIFSVYLSIIVDHMAG